MPNKSTHTFWIILGTAFFLLLIIFTSLKIYKIAINETIQNHQQQQMAMVTAAVKGISLYLTDIEEDLQIVSSFYEKQFYKEKFFDKLLFA